MTEDNGRRPGLRAPDEARPVAIDHEARARKRMAELRPLLENESIGGEVADKFYAEAPPGWTYEWKLYSVFNKEYPQYLAGLKHQGWSPVPASRVRHLLYDEYTDENCVVDGLILMERPKELTDRRRKQDHDFAVHQIKSKEEAAKYEAPEGTAPRPKQFEGWKPRINTEVGPIGVPE